MSEPRAPGYWWRMFGDAPHPVLVWRCDVTHALAWTDADGCRRDALDDGMWRGALARTRESSTAARERAAIVAWLRSMGARKGGHPGHDIVADAIERGDHHGP